MNNFFSAIKYFGYIGYLGYSIENLILNWILALNSWDDSGVWDDLETWND